MGPGEQGPLSTGEPDQGGKAGARALAPLRPGSPETPEMDANAARRNGAGVSTTDMVAEHGDSSVAIWSSISVGGMPVLKSLQESHWCFDEETLKGIRRAVVDSASLKGYTSWAIGYSVANLVSSLLRDQRRIHPVSVFAKGFHGISDDHEVFLSLPVRLGRAGVLGVAEMELTEEEARSLRRSAKTLWENYRSAGSQVRRSARRRQTEPNPVKIPTKAITLYLPHDPVASDAGSSAAEVSAASPGRRSHARGAGDATAAEQRRRRAAPAGNGGDVGYRGEMSFGERRSSLGGGKDRMGSSVKAKE